MKIRIHRSAWLALVLSAPVIFLGGGAEAAPSDKEPGQDPDATSARASASVFLTGGDLGVVSDSSPTSIQQNPNAVKDAAADAMMALLQERLGITGKESILPIATQPIRVEDKSQRAHIRLKQYVDGLPIEGASLAIHFNSVTGEVLAANGEVHSSDSIVHADELMSLGCDSAMEVALLEYLADGLVNSTDGGWMQDCELAAVQGRDGKAYAAYKRLYEVKPGAAPVVDASSNASSSPALSDPYRVDLLFADRVTGKLVAVHPKIIGARTMTTYNCHNVDVDTPSECTVVTNSPNKINTGDPPVDSAHNNAVDTYDFYLQNFGLAGADGSDLKIQSLAHYDFLLNNAFFTELFGGILVYGDGDGIFYGHWAQFDVVVHEFSHAVTFFSSNLVYSYESGALNEAFSDVMAAAAERLVKNKPPFNVWHMGEDNDLWFGEGIRNMANPPDFGDPDYFANRLTGSSDNGGVHTNSGIMNKAFYLMVTGGTHPVSGIVVPPLSTDFSTSIKQAATIFFKANTLCLTESSDYMMMRECTLLFASSSQTATVQKAWDAVGVKTIRPLVAGVRTTGITLPFDQDVQVFELDRRLNPGEKVTCSLYANNGDPDLSVRFGRPPSLYPRASAGSNNCYANSIFGNETCTTGAATAANTAVYVAVESYKASSNIQLICTVQGTCKAINARCTAKSQCCNPTRTTCDGTTTTNRVCKACKAKAARCTRATECCGTQACDGTTTTNRVCKACKARQAVCRRTTECCAGLKCTSGRCG